MRTWQGGNHVIQIFYFQSFQTEGSARSRRRNLQPCGSLIISIWLRGLLYITPVIHIVSYCSSICVSAVGSSVHVNWNTFAHGVILLTFIFVCLSESWNSFACVLFGITLPSYKQPIALMNKPFIYWKVCVICNSIRMTAQNHNKFNSSLCNFKVGRHLNYFFSFLIQVLQIKTLLIRFVFESLTL